MALALECVYDRTELPDTRGLLQEALEEVSKGFLDKQEEGEGVIGNIYSTSLAMQVLETASKFYAPRQWDCAQAFSAVYSHQLQQPMAVAQAVPALVHKPYLDAASLDCSVVAVTIPQLPLSPSQATTAQEGTAPPPAPRGDAVALLQPPAHPSAPQGPRSQCTTPSPTP